MKRYFFLIILITCGSLAALAYQLLRQQQERNLASDWVMHSYEVLKATRTLFIDLQDQEIGARGYFMTADAKFLKPYAEGFRRLTQDAIVVQNLVVDNSGQAERAKRVAALVREHAQLIDGYLKVFASGEAHQLTLHDLELSNASLERVHEAVEDFQTEEARLLLERRNVDTQQRERYTQVLVIGCILALAGLLVSNAVIFRMAGAQRRVSQKLHESEQRFLLAMKGLNDGIYEFLPQAGSIYLSPRLKEMLGYGDDEFPNTVATFQAHLHPEDADIYKDALQRYYAHETNGYRSVFRLRHKDGSYLWMLARGMGEWDSEGRIVRLVGAHTDITEQKAREEHLAQLNQDLESFTYLASHDLRSPLVNMKGFASEITFALNELKDVYVHVADKLDEEERATFQRIIEGDLAESLQFIHSAVDKMDRLTNAIVDLSRIGRRELKREPVNMEALARRCADALGFEINEKGAEVIIEPLPDIVGDATALEQVLGNILDNAVKYLDPSRPGRIVVRGEAYLGAVNYLIQDNGRGVDAQERDKVFGMFRRASNAQETRGIGMGMAYVKALVHRMDGSIAFTSRPGTGTTFSVTLPQRKGAAS